jgi:hypothetical protein
MMLDLNALTLILGSVLALSGIIVAKKPDAKAMIDRLVPYQAVIGVAMIVLGVINFVRLLPSLADMMKANLLQNAAVLTVIGASVLLGALFGMPQIAKLIPDPTANQKAVQISQRVAPYQVLLGLIGLAASLVYFLYRFKLLTLSA